MSAHTPGPIQVDKCGCGHPSCSQYTLSTQRSVGFDLADAQLYAAAPDLLAACQRILCRVADTQGLTIEPGDGIAMILANAIARATVGMTGEAA